MKVLYFDLVGGIAGDMTVAALIALGVPLDHIREGLKQIGLLDVDVSIEQASRHGISGKRFLVSPTGGKETHPHRAYSDIRKMVETSTLPPGAKERSLAIFGALATAEAAVHGVEVEKVTFHEVGAWDSIADVVAVAIGLAFLQVERVICSAVPVGTGTVKTAHGVMPVPTPATLELLKGFPVDQGGPAFERTTPTGAAILAALAQPAPKTFSYTPLQIGIGVGTREDEEIPNILRAVLCQVEEEGSRDVVGVAEANLDDTNPEWIGYLVEQLMDVGALDVALVPITMKKNRPGTQVQVIYPLPLQKAVQDMLFSETTTLGVRLQTVERVVLPRKEVVVQTQWGEVRGKVATLDGKNQFSPEYEACATVARETGVPLREVYAEVQRAFGEQEK